MKIEDLINLEPYSKKKNDNNNYFFNLIKKISLLHFNKCKSYKKILDHLKFNITKIQELKNLPFIPASVFKDFDLKSISDKKIVKKLMSSGTSGKPSKIYLDRYNSINQIKVLKNLMQNILGKNRLPMLIIDQNPKMENRISFNAKIAAINGFSIYGRDHTYLLNKDNKINYKTLNNFLQKFSNKNFFIFGFTSLVYEYFIRSLNKKKINFNFKNGILLHGGGWKKLERLKLDSKEFNKRIGKKLKIKKIYNYYGLIEQTGSIFLECEYCGYFHTSIYSDIFIRGKNFEVLNKNKKGIVQLISLLPTSYPGHNILTEDIGEIKGEDDCPSGKKGKYFKIYGRAKQAEIRGCSDTL